MQEIKLRIRHDEIELTTNNEVDIEKIGVGDSKVTTWKPIPGYIETKMNELGGGGVLGTASNNDEAVTLMSGYALPEADPESDNGVESYEAYLKVKEKALHAKEEQFVGQLERAKELLGKRGLNVRAMNYILTGERATRPSRKASQRRKV